MVQSGNQVTVKLNYMKKMLILILFLFTLFAHAQKKQNGYFSLRGGAAFKDDITKGIGHLSVGVSTNDAFGLGFGIGYIHFDKPYIPVTADISFFGKPGKISPVIIGSAGVGIFNGYAKIRGGFTGSLNAGISFPGSKKSKFFVTGGMAIYSFTGGENIATATTNITAESNIKMITVTGGFKL
jgi:hypothetical protein